jgi:hypothetical protein
MNPVSVFFQLVMVEDEHLVDWLRCCSIFIFQNKNILFSKIISITIYCSNFEYLNRIHGLIGYTWVPFGLDRLFKFVSRGWPVGKPTYQWLGQAKLEIKLELNYSSPCRDGPLIAGRDL